MYVFSRNHHGLRERAVARHAQNRGVRVPSAFVAAPADRRIDDDFRAAGFPAAVRPENARQRDSRIEPAGDENVAMVQSRGPDPDHRLSLARLGSRNVLEDEFLGTPGFV